jgi:stress response protein YsnF
MAERTLTAMYDTRGAAESARNDLVALGISSADITIRGSESGSSSAGSTSSAAQESKGFWGSLGDALFPEEDSYTYAEGIRRGGYLLSARVPDGLEDQALDVLERYDPVDVDERAESWRQSGWAGYQASGAGTAGATTAAYGGSTSTSSRDYGTANVSGTSGTAGSGLGTATVRTGRDEDVVERAEEELRVGKREVGRGGVRVRSYVTERPVEEQVSLREERVQVERRAVDRPVQPGDAAFQERTIEATERGEEAVVSKEARVVEEIGIRKDVDTRTETVRDTVRQQEVEVEDDRTTGRGLTSDDERLTTGTTGTSGRRID